MDQRTGIEERYREDGLGGAAASPRSAALVWLMAVRVKTLILSLVPVLAGSFWAWYQENAFRLDVFVLAGMAAMAIQIGTNLWNDACDGTRGHDHGRRLGPPRVTALGLVPAARVRGWALAAFAVALACGAGLAVVGGWVIVAIGLVSIMCGLAYSAGPVPIAFTPFGELFVIVFFGLVAVVGTFLLHSGTITMAAVHLGTVIGLPAAAVLLVNNHRDRVADERAGRRTLAILLGRERTPSAYVALLGFAMLGGVFLVWPACGAGWLALALCAGFAVALGSGLWRSSVSAALNRYLALTGLFQLALALTIGFTALACG